MAGRFSWLENAYSHPFWWAILTRKVGETELVFVCDQVCLCVQDYKSLCPVVTICATLTRFPLTWKVMELIWSWKVG